MTTLLLSSRHTDDDQALWRAAVHRGWQVERARGVRIPEINDEEIVIYMEALFAFEIAKQLNRALLDPSEDWLVHLPIEYCQRAIQLMTMREARQLASPAFIKPPNDKSFEANIYAKGSDLPSEYDDSMAVLVAEPVRWLDEFRCFLLDGKVKAISPHWRGEQHAKLDNYFAPDEELAEAASFAERVASAPDANVLRAVVLNVGTIQDVGWAVVEANGAWGSGIYGCDPDAALDVIRAATIRT
jgi:hypothetical protein